MCRCRPRDLALRILEAGLNLLRSLVLLLFLAALWLLTEPEDRWPYVRNEEESDE